MFTIRPRNVTTHGSAGEAVSPAADKGYDWRKLREKLRTEDVRLLIKHRIFWPIDHVLNARFDGARRSR
jgi:IS5 family transposase